MGAAAAGALSSRADRRADLAVLSGFDGLAQAYAGAETSRAGCEARDFVSWISPEPAGCVLDVATGCALVARNLAPWVKRVIALDLSHSMLCQARRAEGLGANLFFASGNAACLPFPDALFDLLTCTYALANFRELLVMLRESARVVSRSGRVALMDVIAPEDPSQQAQLNALEAMRGDFYTYIRAYSEWLELFRSAGLTLIESQFRRARQRLTDWLRLSPAASNAKRALALRKALFELSGKAGLVVRQKGRETELQYRTAWFLLRPGAGC